MLTSKAGIFHSGSSRTSRPSRKSGPQINPDKTPMPPPFTISLWIVTVSFVLRRGFSSNLNSLTGLIGEDPTSWPAAITWRLDPIVIPKLLYRAWRASPFQICGRGT
jgi:hypothetical protein